MKTKKTEDWLKKELLKDHQEILQHKKRVTEEIKKSGINEYLSKQKTEVEMPKKSEEGENDNSIWKKIKKTLKF